MRFLLPLSVAVLFAALAASENASPKYGVRRNITSTEGGRKREGKGEERRSFAQISFKNYFFIL